MTAAIRVLQRIAHTLACQLASHLAHSQGVDWWGSRPPFARFLTSILWSKGFLFAKTQWRDRWSEKRKKLLLWFQVHWVVSYLAAPVSAGITSGANGVSSDGFQVFPSTCTLPAQHHALKRPRQRISCSLPPASAETSPIQVVGIFYWRKFERSPFLWYETLDLGNKERGKKKRVPKRRQKKSRRLLAFTDFSKKFQLKNMGKIAMYFSVFPCHSHTTRCLVSPGDPRFLWYWWKPASGLLELQPTDLRVSEAFRFGNFCEIFFPIWVFPKIMVPPNHPF